MDAIWKNTPVPSASTAPHGKLAGNRDMKKDAKRDARKDARKDVRKDVRKVGE